MQNTFLSLEQSNPLLQRIKLYLLRLKAALLLKFVSCPLQPGQIICSPGGTFKYKIIGACCRLYDREKLPYPCFEPLRP